MDSEVKKKLVETSKHLIPGIPDSPRVYGGQIIGQALTAAQLTTSDNFHPHSLHCYFLSGADKNLPLVYHVDKIRDGRSFCNRFVKAVQNGVAVFTSEISFHKEEAESINHQTQMPDVPSPDELDSVETLFCKQLENCTDEKIRKQTILRMQHLPVAFDMRPVNAQQFLRLKATEPKYFCWIKVKDLLANSRALVHGRLWSRDKKLVLSTAQEVLIRAAIS
ncbi:Acyl-coenzyme A thioesterase 8 [Trichinella pseudospiralis]|uniref:Acyl-coenzyme A thioesterase 8 n=1 Tax=Trichinella pseudospiralis TaxID=6337 RepID=A0A0V0XLG4_TRIPS|nr:Acyl-coenzyme A thioesterase 8 [Trichinella pseudospiralis]